MSPEAQRIAIAEACGLVTGASLGYTQEQAAEFYRPDPNGTYHDIATFTKKHVWVHGFDPLHDLNAMHEAEKVLTDVAKDPAYPNIMRDQRLDFAEALAEICTGRGIESSYYGGVGEQEIWACAHATAAQRAEAFLRTIGKWVD